MLGDTIHVGKSDWRQVACGCCAGIAWGGESPEECSDCRGNGSVYVNEAGVAVLWPGGPFTGHSRDEGRELWENPWKRNAWLVGKKMHCGSDEGGDAAKVEAAMDDFAANTTHGGTWIERD